MANSLECNAEMLEGHAVRDSALHSAVVALRNAHDRGHKRLRDVMAKPCSSKLSARLGPEPVAAFPAALADAFLRWHRLAFWRSALRCRLSTPGGERVGRGGQSRGDPR